MRLIICPPVGSGYLCSWSLGKPSAGATLGPGLQAGSKEDVAWRRSAGTGADNNECLSSFLVCVLEAPDPPQGALAETHIAAVAVDTSTGSVLYDDFR